MKWLHAHTPVYYQDNEIYDIFSQAEDFPMQIYTFLKPFITGKILVDYGCGTGKYTSLYAPFASKVYAMDISLSQIERAKNKTKQYDHITYMHLNESEAIQITPIGDVAIACWVLGTIKNTIQRKKSFQQLVQYMKPWSTIFFVENNHKGEFEQIRNKLNDPHETTQQYNTWLQEQWAKCIQTLDTYFQFQSLDQAKSILTHIRWDAVWARCKNAKIQHIVDIYIYQK